MYVPLSRYEIKIFINKFAFDRDIGSTRVLRQKTNNNNNDRNDKHWNIRRQATDVLHTMDATDTLRNVVRMYYKHFARRNRDDCVVV